MWLRRRRASDPLRSCPLCHGPFTCPISWEPSDDEHWLIVMRCGDCGCWYELTVGNERARQLDRELDVDQRAIRRGLEAMDRERMAAEIEGFVTALGRDLIDPADFAPR
jgi:hypothetical protein